MGGDIVTALKRIKERACSGATVEDVCRKIAIAEDATLAGFGGVEGRRGRRWAWGQKPGTANRREAERAGTTATSVQRQVVSEIVPKGKETKPADLIGAKAKRLRLPKIEGKKVREIVGENCSLIKTVPKDLVPGIERRVKRIYEGTSTPESLQRYLETECGLEDWQAERIVRDQMQKHDAMVRVEQFRRKGVRYVRWMHGNSKEPRHYHIAQWDGKSGLKNGRPNGLQGFVFDLNGEPPVIDEKTGERGWPGQLIGCSCHLEAIG